jgi:hypothetical protein
MRTFRDELGRDWTIKLTIDEVKRVRDLAKFDLLNLHQIDETGMALVQRLAVDVVCVADVAYAVLKPQADKLGVTDSDFAQGLGGEAMQILHEALLAEIRDFFQKLGRTEAVAMIAQAQRFLAAAIKVATEKVDALNIDEMAGRMSTNSPELQAFRPAV